MIIHVSDSVLSCCAHDDPESHLLSPEVRAISATPASATPPPATPAPGATATSATSRPATAATATAATAAATRGTRGTATATRGRAGAANTKNTRREGEIVALEVSRWGEREKEDGEKAELE